MPFTLAHPAAVLPLRRLRLMRTVPLIIGAMAPDIPYYLPWRIAKHIPPTTHTLLGTFTLDLPIGLLLLLFIWLLRAPLAAPLGPGARDKCFIALERFGSRPRNWALAPLSILVGTWTHLAWDSFTHADGWMVGRIPALSAPVSLFSYTGELCHVLQYASSVFGLAVMAIWLMRLPQPMPAGRPADGERSGGPLLLAALFAAAAAAGGLETAEHLLWHIPAAYHLFYLLLTRTTAWFAVLYTLAGIVIVRGRRRAAGASVTQM
ncbi:MAG TPA: DUF4184 family protein [Steroidobacteraceae bacterium]|nr:DUF4184 family protein [Steroidobacteraceae bacterium]